MQDRSRTFLFVFLCILMYLLHMQLRAWLQPEQPPKKDDQKQVQKAKEGEKGGINAVEPPKLAQAEEVPAESITLGSVDAASPYRMLVTLTNRGAAVERIELNSPKFHDLEDRSGYLGHLGLTDMPKQGGCKVGVVGAGTPAEMAGMKVGDVIVQVGDDPAPSTYDYNAAMKKTEPDHTLQIVVERAGQKQTLSATLGRRPLEVVKPELSPPGPDQNNEKGIFVPKTQDPLSFLMTLESYKLEGQKAVRIEEGAEELVGGKFRTGNWKILPKDPAKPDEAAFEWNVPELHLRLVKTYSLAKVPDDAHADVNFPAYHLDLKLEIQNTGDKPITDLAYRLDGPTGLPKEGEWYAYNSKIGPNWRGGAGMRDIRAGYFHKESKSMLDEFVSCESIVDKTVKQLNVSSDYPDEPELYVGVDAQYFAAVMMPQKKTSDEKWFAKMLPIRVGEVSKDINYKKMTDISCRLISKSFDLNDKNAKFEQTFRIFAGPKRPALLALYNEQPDRAQPFGLGDFVYYGWPIFAFVARFMLAILNFFYSIVGNYGISIVLLTVLVRSCMLPISLKQAKNTAKMQELAPELKRISQTYKNDREQMQKAQMELYRKHGHNPFAGCLPVFLQLPIFIGLYKSLAVNVELRQAPLISESIRWCSNLAAPDMLVYWKDWWFMPSFLFGDMGYGFGPYLNILPLFTMALFIFQQKMFMPPPTDEQSAMQQKVMMYMTVLMGVMFFRVASGLCIYFICSSLWGIAEKKLLPKPDAKNAATGKVLAVAKSGGISSNGKSASERKRRKQRRN